MEEILEFSFLKEEVGLILLVMRTKTKKLVYASIGSQEDSLLRFAEEDFQKLSKKNHVKYVFRKLDLETEDKDFSKLQARYVSLFGSAEEGGKGESETLEYEFLFGTPFQKKVWTELTKVPFGGTVTYGELSRKIGLPNAIRAVGTAVGQNRLAVVIPCHRCLPYDGKIGKFRWGANLKQKLLLQEKMAKKKENV